MGIVHEDEGGWKDQRYNTEIIGGFVKETTVGEAECLDVATHLPTKQPADTSKGCSKEGGEITTGERAIAEVKDNEDRQVDRWW